LEVKRQISKKMNNQHLSKYKCYACNEVGHLSNACPNLQNKNRATAARPSDFTKPSLTKEDLAAVRLEDKGIQKAIAYINREGQTDPIGVSQVAASEIIELLQKVEPLLAADVLIYSRFDNIRNITGALLDVLAQAQPTKARSQSPPPKKPAKATLHLKKRPPSPDAQYERQRCRGKETTVSLSPEV